MGRMDPSRPVPLGVVWIIAWAGFGVGWLYATLRRAWRDVAGYKKAVTTTRKAAWSRSIEAVLLGFLLAVAVAYAVGASS